MRRRIFHSEADFQFEFAWQLRELEPDVEIRLERPIRDDNQPAINVDLMAKLDGRWIAIELKYVTAKLNYVVNGEIFSLTGQSAQDVRRYDIVKDVSRVESLVASGVAAEGHSVTLTNDPSLWQASSRQDTVDAAFRLHDGHSISGSIGWTELAGRGTTRGREATIQLAGRYVFDWEEYSTVESERNGRFRSLTISVQADELC